MKPNKSDRGGDKHTNRVTNKYGSPPVFNRSLYLVGLLTKKIDVSSKERKKKRTGRSHTVAHTVAHIWSAVLDAPLILIIISGYLG